jgi:two-component system, LytTR family, response regulator
MMKAVIIDDEIAAIHALEFLIKKHLTNVEIVQSSTGALEGISIIEAMKPEIVFLDISMPDMSGFSLLKQLKHKDFNLIFTTAHERYAIQAIKHHASDYLVKPIDIDELKAAVNGITERNENDKLPESSAIKKLEYSSRIGLPVKEGLLYQPVSEIIWIESDGNYCTFHTTDGKKYVVCKNIGEYEEMLPSKEFFRIHKSYLINMRMVKKYIRTDGYYVEMEDSSVIEVARRKKDEFLQYMNGIN